MRVVPALLVLVWSSSSMMVMAAVTASTSAVTASSSASCFFAPSSRLWLGPMTRRRGPSLSGGGTTMAMATSTSALFTPPPMPRRRVIGASAAAPRSFGGFFGGGRGCGGRIIPASSGGRTTTTTKVAPLSSSSLSSSRRGLLSTSTAMAAAAARGRGGLEVVTEGATPTEGGMTLYLKAGPDGESAGDCPFAHLVRMVLHIKGLPYDLRPCASDDDKPSWLLEDYGGSMPALRHRAECYVESDVIAQYLDFFFPDPPLSLPSAERGAVDEAMGACDGFFPALARYLKHTPDGDEEDAALGDDVEKVLQSLEDRLTVEGRTGPYLVGDGERLSLVDCALAPKLYHMQVGLKGFKGSAIDVQQRFPALQKYMDVMFALDSFRQTQYPEETVLWGWGNARKK